MTDAHLFKQVQNHQMEAMAWMHDARRNMTLAIEEVEVAYAINQRANALKTQNAA